MRTNVNIKVVAAGFACLALILGFIGVSSGQTGLGGLLIFIAVASFFGSLFIENR
jgi:hypothetical protein